MNFHKSIGVAMVAAGQLEGVETVKARDGSSTPTKHKSRLESIPTVGTLSDEEASDEAAKPEPVAPEPEPVNAVAEFTARLSRLCYALDAAKGENTR